MGEVTITGIGLVTPLGDAVGEILDRLRSGVSAAEAAPFVPPLVCRQFARVPDFDAQRFFPENKTLRLMNRDAQLAVVAARRAMQDARLVPGEFYAAEEIGLFGATGLSGMAPEEIARLVRDAATPDGRFDVRRFGAETLRHVRPVLSFKILANMPICFVSIFENLRGPNAVYTPWEGHGAQAIAAGVRAIRAGEIPCAVVGGCDVKTHVLSLVSLQQFGALDSWRHHGQGSVPGEGAAFLVLEEAAHAARRGAPRRAVIREFGCATTMPGESPAAAFQEVLRGLPWHGRPAVVAAADGDAALAAAERAALAAVGLDGAERVCPKAALGNLYAAAAATQVALAAQVVEQHGPPHTVLADCFGFGGPQAAFLLEAVEARTQAAGGKISPEVRPPEAPPLPQSRASSGPCPAARLPARRVVVTGVGVVSPVGSGRESFWSALTAGRSGVGPITLFDASTFPVRIGGEVSGFDPRCVHERFPESRTDRDRKVLLALAAADEALADAGLADADWQDALLHVGVGLETICLEDFTALAQAADFGRAMTQVLLPGPADHTLQTPLDRIATLLGNRCGFRAGRYTNCSACAAGTQALGEAWQMLQQGAADVALAGGADSMLNPMGLGGFSLLRVLAAENDQPQRACRPFDVTRAGTVLGEGAAFVVLEVLERALARGANVVAEVLGYGSSLDAFAATDPEPCGRGAVDAMRRALHSAHLQPADIDCVNAHATGTPKNDLVETLAIKEALGPRAREIPVHAVKSMTGHLIAASGAVEAVAAALTVARGIVPPTINLERPDPQCDLDYVAGAARPLDGDTVLSNSFGFGGQNATLILGRYGR